MSRIPSLSIWQRAGALLLVLALMWAQAAGVAHRVLHAGLVPVAAVDVAREAAGPLAHLLGGKAGDADCRLYDQLAHGDALPLPAVMALPPLPPLVVAAVETAVVLRAPCSSFQARAPPVLR